MGQKKDSQKSPSTKTAKATAFLGAEAAVDPLLASLFESSVRYVYFPRSPLPMRGSYLQRTAVANIDFSILLGRTCESSRDKGY